MGVEAVGGRQGRERGQRRLEMSDEGRMGHPALKLLELGHNPLGAAGTKALVDVVKCDLPVSSGGGGGC